MEIKNISLALWDQKPKWDLGDGYTKYIDEVDPTIKSKQKDSGRYRVDMIAHDRSVAHKMACKLLWPLSRHRTGNQYNLHKEWYEEQFAYATEIKDQIEDGEFDAIHPPLVGIPYRPGGKMNKRRCFDEPSIIIAVRMRPTGDLWDQQTIHHWVILWRVKTGDQVRTLQFKIEDKKVMQGENDTVCRRTKYGFCPIDLPDGLFRYTIEEGTHIRDEQEADFLGEYKKHKVKEQKAAKQYGERREVLRIAKQYLKGELNLNEAGVDELYMHLQNHNITNQELQELAV